MKYKKASKQEVLDFLTATMRNEKLLQTERLKACERLFEYYFKIKYEPEEKSLSRVVIVDDIAKITDVECQTE